MSDDKLTDPYLQALAELKPGDPIPPAPTRSLEEQVDDAATPFLTEWFDLQMRLLTGPPLTPEESARKADLARLVFSKTPPPSE